MFKFNSLHGAVLTFTFLSFARGIPVPPNAHCPVPTTNEELGTSKVLDLHEIKGHKVRLQFFYPSEDSARRLLETTTFTPAITNGSSSGEQSGSASVEVADSSTEHSQGHEDIFCQWTFKAGNESQFLSLTFEKLSAPYSDNCAEAFVALQKENGYESRWCGNRRQANARPMSLLARSSVVITVFRRGNAPILPSTGFKVAVRELDIGSLQGAESSLRILLG